MISDEWLLGFIEGEGCFSTALLKRKGGYQPVPIFAIKLSAQDKGVLEKIKKKLGLGRIYFQDEKKYKKNPDFVNHAYIYRTTNVQEAYAMADFLKPMKFVSKSKKRDFESWCKCIEIIKSKKHLKKEGLLEIAALRDPEGKRKQWNKKSYCNIRAEIDPCEIYKRDKKVPENCRACLQ